MKGNGKVIEFLNRLAKMERTGIDQYQIHRAMFVNWQLAAAAAYIDERIEDERKHLRVLLDRILFLQGTITPALMDEVKPGADIPEIFANDGAAELGAIAAYQEGIALAESVGDYNTADVLRSILADETDHMNDIEARQMQMDLVGLQNWIAQQMREAA